MTPCGSVGRAYRYNCLPGGGPTGRHQVVSNVSAEAIPRASARTNNNTTFAASIPYSSHLQVGPLNRGVCFERHAARTLVN